jgi:hypothetical protein
VLAAANGGYGFAEGTFAGTHRNEQDAPEAVICRLLARSLACGPRQAARRIKLDVTDGPPIKIGMPYQTLEEEIEILRSRVLTLRELAVAHVTAVSSELIKIANDLEARADTPEQRLRM